MVSYPVKSIGDHGKYPREPGVRLIVSLFLMIFLTDATAETAVDNLERTTTKPFQNYRENTFSIRSGDSSDAGSGFIAPDHNDFENIGEYAVLDKASGLVWQKFDDEEMKNWTEAGVYCEELDLDGAQWRLPSRAELLSLVDFDRTQPAINTDYFPTTKSFNYWASTPYTGTEGHAWSILFSEGNAYCFLRELKNYVRCVRDP